MEAKINRIGSLLVDAFHYLALFAIGGAIVCGGICSSRFPSVSPAQTGRP